MRHRVYITENCNADCKSCFNRNSRTNAIMSVTDFEELCQWFKSEEDPVTDKSIRLMGGEPTTHPDFLKIYEIAQNHFESVSLFTNGLLPDILNKINPREEDSIIYNSNFIKVFKKEMFLLDKSGKRTLETQVRWNTDEKALLAEFERINNFWNSKTNCNFSINFTLDCTANIFKTRKNL